MTSREDQRSRLAAAKFENFTLQPTTGYFQGKAEDWIVIEIVQAQEKDVANLAKSIRRLNGQKSVLTVEP